MKTNQAVDCLKNRIITYDFYVKGYLPHQIRIKFKHPKFLDGAKVENIHEYEKILQQFIVNVRQIILIALYLF
jgi:hypothetical protein